MKLNIICVLWKGDFSRNGKGKVYYDSDVDALEKTVSNHLDHPYNMYCLTNDMAAKVNAEKIPLKHNWPGWWSKIELFRPDLPKGKTIFFDLDDCVLNDLSPLIAYEDDLVLFEKTKEKNVFRRKKFRRCHRYWTGALMINSLKYSWLYQDFAKNAKKHMNLYRGIDDILSDWLPDNMPTFPREWMQRLRHIESGQEKFDPNTIIMAGAGNADFRNVNSQISSMK